MDENAPLWDRHCRTKFWNLSCLSVLASGRAPKSLAAFFNGSEYAGPLALAHRVVTALRALSLRSSGVSLAARAGPPLRPPLRPNATACRFFLLLAMTLLYVSGQEHAKKR